MKMDDSDLCEECQEKFDKQNGQLLVADMCDNCSSWIFLTMLEPNDGRLH